MTLLLYFFICAMILLCVAGAGLALGLLIPRPWVAVPLAPWVLATLFFAIEGVVPLGRPGMLIGVLFTLGSGWLLAESQGWSRLLSRRLSGERLERWRAAFALTSRLPAGRKSSWGWPRLRLEPFGGILLVLVLGFSYAMTWRFAFPNIDASSEKLCDLAYLVSYLAGDGVPSKDYWYPPFPNVQYYSFQYYAAALLGRAFALGPGLTYNISFCLMISLITTSGVGLISTLGQRLWVRVLCGASLLVGGTGVSGLIYWLCNVVNPWTSIRFVGCEISDKPPLGTWVQQFANDYYKTHSPNLQLPGEPLSYSVYLGDYHPPLAGLYLLLLGLLLVSQYYVGGSSGPAAPRDRSFLLAALGGTIPWSLIANTWSTPLQALMVGGWLAYNAFVFVAQQWGRQRGCAYIGLRESGAIVAGALAVVLLTLHYLILFLPASESYSTHLRLVPVALHSPPLQFVLFLFPVIVLIVLGLLSRRRTIMWIAFFWLLMLAFTECFYIDDVYSGPYERFNSTLKWWPWVSAGTICSLAPLILSLSRRYVLVGLAAIVVGYPCVYAWELADTWWNTPKFALGLLNGDDYLNRYLPTKLVYDRLKYLPVGVTLEHPEGMAYTTTSALSSMAAKPCWLGWLGHEQLWRGYSPELGQRYQKWVDFYAGNPQEVDWLRAVPIRYILWCLPEDSEANRVKLNNLIKDHYRWVETYNENGRSTGYWLLED